MSKSKVKTKAKAKAKTPAKTKSKVKTKSKKASTKASAVGDWRAETLARLRSLIMAADPQMTEERKWIKPTRPLGVPLWSHDGMVATGEIYTKVVKITFAYGASLPDPARLFNASLEGGTRRAIDIPEGGKLNERAFKALVKAAVARNVMNKKR